MQLFRYLQMQGLGSKKQCQQWIKHERIMVNNVAITKIDEEIISEDVHSLKLDEQDITFVPLPFFYLLLNKPSDYETSHKPKSYPSIFSLLPANIRQLDLQAVGRLDADTTGLILITNDGQYNHFLTSPKNHISKIYEVTLKHPADDKLLSRLLEGVYLKDDMVSCKAKNATLTSPQHLQLEIQEGKYHQIKRMVAAAGNRVEQLHRTTFGPYQLDELAQGQWQLVTKK